MNDFEQLKSKLKGTELPIMAVNNSGETVIIEGNKDVLITTTVQRNGWLRINEYYPDGTATETYER